MKSITKILIIGLCLLSIVSLGYVYYQYKALQTLQKKEEATVVLKSIQKVSKLVTVEAHLSEVYDYKDYYYYDFFPFRKKVLIRVNASVSAGYDFKGLDITVDEKNHEIRIDSFPNPSIISLDHDLDYYDIQEGTFNSFSEQDLTEIQQRAKDFIEDKAIDSQLLERAVEQKEEYISMLELVVETMGWRLSIAEERLKG